jgi:putative heme-binding domain-containing protein
LAEPRLGKSPVLAGRVLAMADDPNPRVRFQCALSLGELNDEKVISSLARIAERDMNDRWTRAAVLTSVDHHADELLHLLLAGKNKSTEGMSAMLVELCRMLGIGAPPEKLSALLGEVTASGAEGDTTWQTAAVTGIAEGVRSRGLAGPGQSALLTLTEGDSAEATKARSNVERLMMRAMQTAKDAREPLSARLVAMGLLAHGDFSVVGGTLQGLIDPQQPSEIQVLAVRALGRMNEPSAAAAFMKKDRWGGYTPPVRDAVLAAIMGQPRLIKALLAAIESGDVPAWTVNEDRRTQLMNHKDEDIKSRATALFKKIQGSDRMKVYQEYKSILDLKPDPRNGHAVFIKTCTGCHVFAGEGHSVGPDLTGIRNQPNDVLLLHIIVPEYEIMPTYTCYNVETRDGRTLTGLLAGETPSNITLRQALAHDEIIPRADIVTMTASSLSLMPDELEKTMSRQELADLIGFLKGM